MDKNKLAYSALSDTVFYIDGKGNERELPKGNFIQMVLLWMNEGETPKVGEKFLRELKVGNETRWELTVKRTSK